MEGKIGCFNLLLLFAAFSVVFYGFVYVVIELEIFWSYSDGRWLGFCCEWISVTRGEMKV
jgi:hypothetical protein